MSTRRELRADAAENRERLLDAAAELFAARGLGVSLNDIAHHAGVGVGTAYRRFANKAEVVDALFERRLQNLADVAHDALADPDPWRALVSFLEGSLDTQFGDLGMHTIMNDIALGDARVQEARDRIAPLITALVARAKDHGDVRDDFDQSDVIFIQVGLAAIMNASRHVAPQLYKRYTAMFLDGVRRDGTYVHDLPVGPLSAKDTHRAMTTRRNHGGRDS